MAEEVPGIPGASADVNGVKNANCYHGNGTLGPIKVHDSKALQGMLDGWDRNGGLDDSTLLRYYFKNGSADWPNDDIGNFIADSNNKPLKEDNYTIPVGTYIDRFGKEDDSAFFAPFGTPFAARSLPANLLFQDYNAYKVIKEFTATKGLIAPGFAQPGRGTQLVVPAKNGVKQTPKMLRKADHLRKLTPDEIEILYAKMFLS